MNLSRHVWVVSALLAACASQVHWEKPGGTEAALKEDSDQCQRQAALAPSPPRYAPMPEGSATIMTHVLQQDDQRGKLEAEEFQKCMTGKGYSAKR